ncbi:hypothetical protein OKJ48_22475 [Streptomyces kunmingensis]|uniref:Bulb-type lectin domain-containing protein n=1 Tax=Streptomyces kunmingensis TaxID=68225 RepID=A0ABU6CFM9_9ACTN|nr:hypothetical protein [Streptomyces kunmingensis]MEB3962991.1 hypothetical protein [Streptomyces kunmingensis]
MKGKTSSTRDNSPAGTASTTRPALIGPRVPSDPDVSGRGHDSRDRTPGSATAASDESPLTSGTGPKTLLAGHSTGDQQPSDDSPEATVARSKSAVDPDASDAPKTTAHALDTSTGAAKTASRRTSSETENTAEGDTGTSGSDAGTKDGDSASDKPEAESTRRDDGAAERKNAQWSRLTVDGGTVLHPGESVASNRMRIKMSHTGNLVISDENGVIRWASHTAGEGYKAVFSSNGNLIVRTQDGRRAWSSRTKGHDGAQLVIHRNGNVTVSVPDGTVLWSAGTQH